MIFSAMLSAKALLREGIHSHIAVTLVQERQASQCLWTKRGEPAYLGYPGNLKLKSLLKNWFDQFDQADALFSDGWVEHDDAPSMILEAFHGLAKPACLFSSIQSREPKNR